MWACSAAIRRPAGRRQRALPPHRCLGRHSAAVGHRECGIVQYLAEEEVGVEACRHIRAHKMQRRRNTQPCTRPARLGKHVGRLGAVVQSLVRSSLETARVLALRSPMVALAGARRRPGRVRVAPIIAMAPRQHRSVRSPASCSPHFPTPGGSLVSARSGWSPCGCSGSMGRPRLRALPPSSPSDARAL